MPAPTYRTKIAKLRRVCGLDQKEFAKLIGRSVSTIQSLESEKHELTEELAKEIAQQTGASLDWLMFAPSDVEAEDIKGRPFTRQWFEEFTKIPVSKRPVVTAKDAPYFPGKFGASIEAALANARANKQGASAAYSILRFTRGLMERFGCDNEVHDALNQIAEQAYQAGELCKPRKRDTDALAKSAVKIGKASLSLRAKIGKP